MSICDVKTKRKGQKLCRSAACHSGDGGSLPIVAQLQLMLEVVAKLRGWSHTRLRRGDGTGWLRDREVAQQTTRTCRRALLRSFKRASGLCHVF